MRNVTLRNRVTCDHSETRDTLPSWIHPAFSPCSSSPTCTHEPPPPHHQPFSLSQLFPHLDHLNMGRQPTLSLASIGDQLALYSRPLHPTFLPYGALGLIHAARVSHATRQVAGSHKCRLGLWQSFLLNQILMFSGVVLSGMLLGIPSPLLGSWPFVVLYGGMHVLLDVTPGGKWLLNLQDQELVGMM